MDTTQLKQEFEQILADVVKINGLPLEQATQVATVLLVERNKFQRTEMLSQARQSNGYYNSQSNGNEPASEKQLKALKSFGVSFNEGITKADASKLLEPHMARMKARNGAR